MAAVGCCFSVQALVLGFVVWGAWLNYNVTALEGQCARNNRYVTFLTPVNGFYLEGHVFLNLSVELNRDCQDQCTLARDCVSYNTGPRIDNKMACELSNSDDLQHPENLKPRRDWNYRGTKNLCAKKPCLNNGKCYMGYTEKRYVCVCPAGYHGENCEKDINECESSPCLNNGTCTDRINAFNCSCPPGFSGNRCEIG
ncbi:uncharacterized protein [Porites lutea]|uniref:uncharacterized protein isoform X1 n=1 Tax=Porites lutea TaxID=51062 RepID=UPI003CC6794D